MKQRIIYKDHLHYPVTLMMCLCLVMSANACSIAKYDLVNQELPERRNIEALEYEPPVSFVIPSYYIMHGCGWGGLTPCRNLAGSELYAGVTAAGMGGNFTEQPPQQGTGVRRDCEASVT